MKNDLPDLSADIQREPIVRVTGLTKQVGNAEEMLTILNNVEFDVMPGEAVAIVGASGSGKSTLLGLLAGLDMPSSGQVFITGTDLFSLGEDARALLRGRVLGFVFQSFQLLPALNALENVMLPLELAGRSDAEERAKEILLRVGLGQRLRHYPKQLSGGEQQRVALARAFVTGPQLLLADEPTGNLDARTGSEVTNLLFELNREQGTTLILVTHDNILASRCIRRIRLAGGQIVAMETAN